MSVDSDKATCKPREKYVRKKEKQTHGPLGGPHRRARRGSSSSGMAEEDVI